MTDQRYLALTKLYQNKWVIGCPVEVSTGMLLLDKQSKSVILQLKLRNVSVKSIRQVDVSIIRMDLAGDYINQYEEPVEYTYIDLTVGAKKTFGDRQAIVLGQNATRQVKVIFAKVVFADGEIWRNDSLDEGKEVIASEMSNSYGEELTRQFNHEYIEKYGRYMSEYRHDFVPEVHLDYWLCACGFPNEVNNQDCSRCGISHDWLFNVADSEFLTSRLAELKEKEIIRLKKERQERLEKERIAAEKAELKAEENRIAAEKAAKKRKKIVAITTPIVCACIAFVIVLTTVIIPKQKLNKAMSLLDSGDYDSAYTFLEEIGYSDAIVLNKYDRAVKHIDSGDYDSAYALLEEIGYIDAIASSKYDRAIKLIDSGDYDSAYMLLDGLSYKDSNDKLHNIIPKYKQALFAKASVGDIVFFGAYEQDNNTSNGKEDIEWQVLAKEDNKVLVISKYALDSQPYNASFTDVTWESCSLRKWMNETFLNNAFSTEEQAQILNTNVTADKNPNYNTNPGKATTDKVFLLSITEAKKYFRSDEARKCAPTAYAAGGAATTSRWWLRSPGDNQINAARISYVGSVYSRGDYVHYEDVCVRPALWFNLDS